MAREKHIDLTFDDDTKRSLTVLADATAEVVGRGAVYDAIVRVANDGDEGDFQDAREKFDHMDIGDRVRIRAQAFENLGDTGEAGEDSGGQLDWANQMMAAFPTLSGKQDGEE